MKYFACLVSKNEMKWPHHFALLCSAFALIPKVSLASLVKFSSVWLEKMPFSFLQIICRKFWHTQMLLFFLKNCSSPQDSWSNVLARTVMDTSLFLSGIVQERLLNLSSIVWQSSWRTCIATFFNILSSKPKQVLLKFITWSEDIYIFAIVYKREVLRHCEIVC